MARSSVRFRAFANDAASRETAPTMLRARLFGDLTVSMDDRPVPPIHGLRPRSLLAFLLVHPGMHPRTRVAGRFWPDVLETSARASLRSALWSIRAGLEQIGADAYLRTDRASVGIAPDLPRFVDAEEFDRLVRLGDPGSLREACDLAGEPLLADLADEWALDAQDAHRERLVTVYEQLADVAEQGGDLPDAIRWTRATLEQDRLREGAHRALMRRLDAGGERAQALAAYRRARTVLAAELGVAPSKETRDLAEALRGGEHPEPPAAPPAAMAPGGGAATDLVGRHQELASVLDAWERAKSGVGGVAQIIGPPGIGKSRLVDELMARARTQGAHVATGAGVRLQGASPLGPWLDVLRDLLDGPPPPANVIWPTELARLSPAVEARWGRSAGAAGTNPDLERLRVFEAVLELVAWSARARPVLIVLEDLQWADPTSAALLAHIGRRLDGLAVLVVATRRVGSDQTLESAVEAVRRRGCLVVDMQLDELSTGDLRRLAGARAPGLAVEVLDRVVAAAGGSPLLAVEGARAAAAGRDPADGLRAAIQRQFTQLESAAQELVEIVCVAGRAVEFAEAAAAFDTEDLQAAFEEGVAAGLFRNRRDRRVSFVHDLIRRACDAEIPARRRAEAHRRFAAALLRRPTRSNAEIARHLAQGGDARSAQRFLAAAAGEARALGALDEAAAFLREALDVSGAGTVADAELWLALADVCAWRGDRVQMDEAFPRAAELFEQAGDIMGLATAHAFRARWLHTTLCYPAEALAAARTAMVLIDRAGEPAPEAHLLALAGAAWAEAVAGDPGAVDGLVERARRTLEGMGDRTLEAELEHVRGTALVRSGAFAEGAVVCARAAELARIAGRPEIGALSTLTGACALACVGDLELALALVEPASLGDAPGPSLTMQLRAARAYTLCRLGRLEEAIAAARENVEAAAHTGSRRDEAVADFDLGSILLSSDAAAEAAERLAMSLEVDGAQVPRALARLRLAEALVMSGVVDQGERALGEVPFEAVRAADLPEALVARLSRVQGLIAAAHGDVALAARRFGEAERVWKRIAATPSGDAYAAILVDIGRPPVAGLVEPTVELERLATDRAALPKAAGAKGGRG